MQNFRKHKTWLFISIFFVLISFVVSCGGTVNLVEAHSFSNLVVDGDTLWFGAGYKLYRVELSQQTATLVLDTDDVIIDHVKIDGRKLFFAGSSEKKNVVWALDLDNEKILWTHEFSRSRGFLAGSSGLSIPPLITNEVLLIGEVDRLYALEKSSGDLTWKIEDNWFSEFPPILADDQLIYGIDKVVDQGTQDNNTIIIADPSSGETIRTISMPGYIGGISAINEKCFFVKEDLDPDPKSVEMSGAHRIRLNCMDFYSGEVFWYLEEEDYLRESQIAFHNGLVLDVFGGQLFALDEQSGNILWISQQLDKDFSYRNPQVVEELEWIALETYPHDKVIFLELKDGKLRNEELVNLLSSPIFIGQEAIYGITNAIVRVDIVTGNVIWSIPVDSHYFKRQSNYDFD
ncbi:MAG: PQQ-binding-like beta-propeller repeat protein [Chloroflexi bacterium]|nr:PQQ-binding-like beta-propeller repeat protein [Chloroflexota bacterium]